MQPRKIMGWKVLLLLTLAIGMIITAVGTWAGIENYIQFLRPSAKNPKVDQGSARQIADEVFKKVNPEASISETELLEKVPANQLIWQIQYGTNGEIWIGAQDGQVLFLINKKRFDELVSSRSSSPLIDQETAMVKGKEIVKTLGLSIPSLASCEVRLIRDQGGIPGLTLWELRWKREKKGYKFHDDFIILGVDAFEGKLLAYNKNCFSDDPSSLEVKITKSEAYKIASRFAAEKGFTLKAEKGENVIVNPNYRWTPKHIETPTRESKLAWVFPFSKAEGEGEIWIDTLTGEVLGGEETR